jgi:hypothetical protein
MSGGLKTDRHHQLVQIINDALIKTVRPQSKSWVIWGRLGPSKIALISPAPSEPLASS